MRNEFYINENKAIINFTIKYCDSFENILSSKAFKKVFMVFVKREFRKKTNNYKNLVKLFEIEDKDEVIEVFIKIFKLLSVLEIKDIEDFDERYKYILCYKYELIEFIEGLYSFWRHLERYSIINNQKIKNGIAEVNFNEANSRFSKLVLALYRKIEKNIIGEKINVFREISAGGNACIMLNNTNYNLSKEYEKLKNIPCIQKISIQAPFIAYPKKNKRDGIFKEVYENPLKETNIYKEKWFCYPAKVGQLLAFIYFHRDFISHGVSLCNLFELAREEEYKEKSPNIIYVFGGEEKADFKTVFFDDKKNNIMLGYANNTQEVDYFGYMKKMVLTLHNLVMIKRGALPIHGAMVNITLKNEKEANIIIVGDSGAGKSESLEALRGFGERYISDMKVVFDDMGILMIENEEIKGYGTEIGAFVRLDDLDQGYAFKELDRSIFMNPDKINARLVMPISSYRDIIKGYKVDMILYANNYDKLYESENGIKYFENKEEAINTFKEGKRMSKGTTTENGMVKSYFSNPFGPLQRRKIVDELLEIYFSKLFKDKIKVGMIKTQLGIDGLEKIGPQKAAIELLEEIMKG